MQQAVLKKNTAIRRFDGNPILTANDVPYESSYVFNAGIVYFQGRYVMIFRNDIMDDDNVKIGQNLGLAFSKDGLKWNVEPKPLEFHENDPLSKAYDPRLTVLDGRLYMCSAISDRYGTRGIIAVTDDMIDWRILNITAPDNRNMVLFPERINGKIYRLERPMAGYLRPGDKFDMYISCSKDGIYWGETEIILNTRQVHWVNDKIGPGAPPIKTDKGWLTFFHGVDIDRSRKWGVFGNWTKRYSAGLLLLDNNDPTKVIGMSKNPIMVPEEEYEYEIQGWRPYVVFPGGLLKENDGSVKIYYGAGDSVEALAFSTVDELLKLCEPM